MSEKTNIAITGTGSLIGQAVIKSIQRSDLNAQLNLIGFDYFKNTVGSFWCNVNYVLPDILKKEINETMWLNFLLEKIIENNIKLLFVGVDFELPLFAKYKTEIEKKTGVTVLVSSEEVTAIANDKYLTYQFLKENNLSHPTSFLPEEPYSDKVEFPLIVKPRKGARSVGVSKVKNSDELKNAINALKEPIVQECIGNDHQEFTCGTIYLGGELKKLIILNRSLKEGNTFISHFQKDFPSVISHYLRNVAGILKPFGACNFQLRLDEKGIPKIFEINARHSGTTFIRTLFGYKEVEYIINYLLFNKEQAFELREGTVVRYYDEFYVSNNSLK